MYIYSKTYRRVEATKFHLSNAVEVVKYRLSNVVDAVRYAESDTYLAIALVSTWVFCAYVASVN
jgi:hypothetical protein